MAAVITGIRFKKAGKVYYFDPAGIELQCGDNVIVETARGIEYGEVALAPREARPDELTKPLKRVLKKGDERDAAKVEENRHLQKEAMKICQERVEAYGLDMKLIDAEYTFDGSKMILYFTSPGRVDFRELVRDLAGTFRTRIELRQIGVRDEAKVLGGLGPCGRPVCCASFLGDFQPVSIKMAKEQNLSLSPTKISGLCGRLMCCLNYEQQYYESVAGKLPKQGYEVETPDGNGIVYDVSALTQRVKVKIELPDGTLDAREFSADDIKILRKRKPSKNDGNLQKSAQTLTEEIPAEVLALEDEPAAGRERPKKQRSGEKQEGEHRERPRRAKEGERRPEGEKKHDGERRHDGEKRHEDRRREERRPDRQRQPKKQGEGQPRSERTPSEGQKQREGERPQEGDRQHRYHGPKNRNRKRQPKKPGEDGET